MNYSAFTTSSILLALVALFSAPSIVTGQIGVVLFPTELDVDDSNSTDTESCESITEILCAEGANLKALCEAISISELNDDLAEDTWTIFAPTDEAFEALGRDNLDSLVFGNDTVPLTDLLLFHIVPGVSLTSDLLPCEAGKNLLEMANGYDSRTKCKKKVLPTEQRGEFNDGVDAPKFIETDIMACNGVIHVMDKVMLYQALPFDVPKGVLETEVTSSTPAPSVPVTASGTTAPSVPGSTGTSVLNTSLEFFEEKVSTSAPSVITTTTGQLESGEELFEVKVSTSAPSVITTTIPTITTTTGQLKGEEPECQTIADIACSIAAFSTACGLLTNTGLKDLLSYGLWTVFVPTNDAFDQAPRFSSDTDLGMILRGHAVMNTTIAFEDLQCTEKIEMSNGKDTRTVCKDGVTYQKGGGNADDQRPEIIETNIKACNGIVHVINQVILP